MYKVFLKLGCMMTGETKKWSNSNRVVSRVLFCEVSLSYQNCSLHFDVLLTYSYLMPASHNFGS